MELHIDEAQREIYFKGYKLKLDHQAYELMVLLAQHPEAGCPRDTIHQVLWQQSAVEDQRLDSVIRSARRALGGALIPTIWKLGPMLNIPKDSIAVGPNPWEHPEVQP